MKRVTDDLDGAFADLERAEAAARAHGLMPSSAPASISCAAICCFPRGDIEGCLREHEQAWISPARPARAELEAQALGGLGDAEYVRGRMICAHRHFERCVELCRAHGFGRIEVANRSRWRMPASTSTPSRAALADALAAAEAARAGRAPARPR